MQDYTTDTEGPTLHDLVNGDFEPPPDGDTLEYHGFHILRVREGGRFQVQYDGHVGQVFEFHAGDYDDVTELVQDLNRNCLMELHHYEHAGDEEGLIQWAGRIMTHDKEKAEENPEKYIHLNTE